MARGRGKGEMEDANGEMVKWTNGKKEDSRRLAGYSFLFRLFAFSPLLLH
jgi:hypothetical protein